MDGNGVGMVKNFLCGHGFMMVPPTMGHGKIL